MSSTTIATGSSSTEGTVGDEGITRPLRLVHFVPKAPGLPPSITLDDVENRWNKLLARIADSKLSGANKLLAEALATMYSGLEVLRETIKNKEEKTEAVLANHDKRIKSHDEAYDIVNKTLQEHDEVFTELTENFTILNGIALGYRPFVDALFLRRLLDEARYHCGSMFIRAFPQEFSENIIVNRYDKTKRSVVWNNFKDALDSFYASYHENVNGRLFQTFPLFSSKETQDLEILVGEIKYTSEEDENKYVQLVGETENDAVVRQLDFFVLYFSLQFNQLKADLEKIEKRMFEQQSSIYLNLQFTAAFGGSVPSTTTPQDPRDTARFDAGTAKAIRDSEYWTKYLEVKAAAMTAGTKRKGPDEAEPVEERRVPAPPGSSVAPGTSAAGGSGGHGTSSRVSSPHLTGRGGSPLSTGRGGSPRIGGRMGSPHSSHATSGASEDMDTSDDSIQPKPPAPAMGTVLPRGLTATMASMMAAATGADPLGNAGVAQATPEMARMAAINRFRVDIEEGERNLEWLRGEYKRIHENYEVFRIGLHILLDKELMRIAVLQNSIVRIVTNEHAHWRPDNLDDYFSAAKRVDQLVRNIESTVKITSDETDLEAETERLATIMFKSDDYYQQKCIDVEQKIDKYIQKAFKDGNSERPVEQVNTDYIRLLVKFDQLQADRERQPAQQTAAQPT